MDEHITPDDLVHAFTHPEAVVDDAELEDEQEAYLQEVQVLAQAGIYTCIFDQMDKEHCLGEVVLYETAVSSPIIGDKTIRMAICESHVTGMGDPSKYKRVE